jgi:hypothetical protein
LVSAWQVRAGGGWWEGSHWRAGRSASVHTPTESICDLALASFASSHAGNGGASAFIFFACFVPLPHPCRAEGGRTALMTMPFVYVGIEHVSIRFTAPHARAPLGSWSTSPRLGHPAWSSLVETHFIFSPLRCTPPLANKCTAGRTPLRPGAQPAVNNQGQSACFDVHRALHARDPLVSSRASANIGRQSLSPCPFYMYEYRTQEAPLSTSCHIRGLCARFFRTSGSSLCLCLHASRRCFTVPATVDPRARDV